MKHESRTKADALWALLIFGVFASCVLFVLLTGAKVYESLVSRNEESYTLRTASQYVVTRFRQGDSADNIFVSDFCGADALCIKSEIGDRQFVTRVYCYDGHLRELFTEAGGDFSPEDGEELIALENMSLNFSGGLLKAVLTEADGDKTELLLTLRSEREVAK